MTASRPTFVGTIAAFTLVHPQVGVLHTDEEADIAEVLRDVETHHQGADQPDPGEGDVHLRTWGTCSTCRLPWPCPTWVDADQLAVLYLGRAQDRVAARARNTLDRLATGRDTRRTA
jgi:hypothetical protein